MRPFEIQSRRIGPGSPCFLIAEAGVNHDGDPEVALRLVDAAADAGADAVKFQTYVAERLAEADAPKADYQQRTTDAGESQLEMLRRLQLPREAHFRLAQRCARRGILFLSTPFEEESADFLEKLGVPAFKIPSGELTNTPFLAHVARKGRPLIVSTGMATMEEVRLAVRAIAEAGNPPLALLHCVSSYPAEPADVNLRAMDALAAEFDLPAGYSDHTTGIEVALAAAARGACILEKHFTLDRGRSGPDHRASLEPGELSALVQAVRRVESALGHGRKEPAASEASTAAVARKSLRAARPIPQGAVLTQEHLVSRRPGTGIPPSEIGRILGRRARVSIPASAMLTWEMLE